MVGFVEVVGAATRLIWVDKVELTGLAGAGDGTMPPGDVAGVAAPYIVEMVPGYTGDAAAGGDVGVVTATGWGVGMVEPVVIVTVA